MSGTADTEDAGLVCGDRISCWIGSMPVALGRKIGRDGEDAPLPMRFPLWAVESHAVVERIYDRGAGVRNDWEITCRPTLKDGQKYQTGADFEESPDDDLIIVLVNTNDGREPDISEVSTTRGTYEGIGEDLAGWEDEQRGDDDEVAPETPE